MKRKALVTLLCLAFSVCVMACGNRENSTEPTATNNVVEVTETVEEEIVVTESVEIEVVEPESVESTVDGANENNTESESIVEDTTEKNQITSSAMGSVNREDFVILDASWEYSNYVDYVEATGARLSEAIIGYHSDRINYNNGQIDGNYGEDAVTNKGIRLGSTKEEVIEAYGTTPYSGPPRGECFKVEGHEAVVVMQYEYLESPTHHYYLYFAYDENDILVGMITGCWIEQ